MRELPVCGPLHQRKHLRGFPQRRLSGVRNTADAKTQKQQLAVQSYPLPSRERAG
jgi:hypothetical protein